MSEDLIETKWTPPATADSRLLKFHSHWVSLGRDGSVPYRKEFKPFAIPELLPFICLVDVLNSLRDFRIRLAGTAIAQGLGQEITGRMIAEIFPPEFNSEVIYHWTMV